MKLKNILLSLGTFTTVVAPIVTIVACGNNDSNKDKDANTETDADTGATIVDTSSEDETPVAKKEKVKPTFSNLKDKLATGITLAAGKTLADADIKTLVIKGFKATSEYQGLEADEKGLIDLLLVADKTTIVVADSKATFIDGTNSFEVSIKLTPASSATNTGSSTTVDFAPELDKFDASVNSTKYKDTLRADVGSKVVGDPVTYIELGMTAPTLGSGFKMESLVVKTVYDDATGIEVTITLKNGTKDQSKNFFVLGKELKQAKVTLAKITDVAASIVGLDNAYTLIFATSTDIANDDKIKTAFLKMVKKASNDINDPKFEATFDKPFDGAKHGTYVLTIRANGYKDVTLTILAKRTQVVSLVPITDVAADINEVSTNTYTLEYDAKNDTATGITIANAFKKMVSNEIGDKNNPIFSAKWASQFDAKTNGDYVLTIGANEYEDVKLTVTIVGN